MRQAVFALSIILFLAATTAVVFYDRSDALAAADPASSENRINGARQSC